MPQKQAYNSKASLLKKVILSLTKWITIRLSLVFPPKGTIIQSLNQFVLELAVNIKDNDDGFQIAIITLSTYSYPSDADVEEYKKGLFITNAPAIIFPYIRAYIASLTALSGLPTLTMPTLNLSGLGEELKNNIAVQE